MVSKMADPSRKETSSIDVCLWLVPQMLHLAGATSVLFDLHHLGWYRIIVEQLPAHVTISESYVDQVPIL